jgi:hypothetical protein
VQIAYRNEPLLLCKGVIEVHGAAAGYEEYVLHALFGDEAHYVVRKLHGFKPG